jgi:hypothetical protein
MPTPPTPLNLKKITIPIEYPEDDEISPPSEAELLIIGNKKIRARAFSIDSSVAWDLNLPTEYDLTEPFRYRLRGVVVAPMGIVGNIEFELSGFSVENGSSISNDFGEPIPLLTVLNQANGTFFVTEWSDDVILDGLTSVDNSNQLKIKRVTPDISPYLDSINITDIEIQYTENLTGIYPTPTLEITAPLDGSNIPLDTEFLITLGLYKVWDLQFSGKINDGSWMQIESININPALTEYSFPLTLTSSMVSIGDTIYFKCYSPSGDIEDIISGVISESYEIIWYPLGDPGLI